MVLNKCHQQNLLEYQTICPTLEIIPNPTSKLEDPPFLTPIHMYSDSSVQFDKIIIFFLSTRNEMVRF